MDARQWDERYAATNQMWGVEPNRFVREQCEQLTAGDALDLACGEGRNAVWLARLGWRVTGVDFSEVAIQRAEEATAQLPADVAQRLTWRVADVSRLDLAPASLDLALASYVQLPPPERDAMLTDSAAALRPAGCLVIVAHDRRNLAEGVSGPQDPVLLYDPAEMRHLLADFCGLVVEVAETVERPTPEGTALDTLVRARRP